MSRESRKIARALKPLKKLKNADEVARYLLDRGIKGSRGSAYNCPIARYVQAETDVRVVVAQRSVSPYGDYMEAVTTPPNVTAFIAMFDLYQYPDLVDADRVEARL